jgi:threonine/homoserine/homoserine lactone efflux protein
MLETSELLVLALAAAFSPTSIAGVLILLGAPGGVRAAIALVVGWTLGLGLAAAVVTLGAALLPAERAGGDLSPFLLTPLLVGAGLLVLGIVQWVRGGKHRPEPRWVAMFERVTPRRAMLLGVGLALLRPKNLAIVLAVGLLIGRAQHGLALTATLLGAFAAVSAIALLAPIALFGVGGPRTRGGIRMARDWTMRHLARIAAGMFVLLGLALLAIGVLRLINIAPGVL